MPTALILSSHVASSRVGGVIQAQALAALGVEPMLAPTVLFGRHPGWGPPGGAAVDAKTFAGVIEGVAANGALKRASLIITGYFASADQVRAAAAAIDRAGPQALIVVDPVMGDRGKGLYVREDVAQAIAGRLVPLAGLAAPNAWELERLSGMAVDNPAGAVAAARALGRPVLVSSVADGPRIAVIYADARRAWMASHERLPHAPNGTGDLLTALFAAHRIAGRSPRAALARATGGVWRAAALAAGQPELSIIGLGAGLRAAWPQAVTVTALA